MRLAAPFTIVAVLAVVSLPPAAAAASLYSNVLRSYVNNQRVPPCLYSSRQLHSVLKSEGPNGGQYDEPLITAINSALAARAGGACPSAETAAAQASAAAQAAAGTPAGVGPAGGAPASFAGPHRSIPVLPVTAATGARLPVPIMLMAALAALLAVLAAILATARMRGWDPVWAAGWRHAWSEAAYRFAATWSELGDRRRSRRSP